jgi:antirestriction protein
MNMTATATYQGFTETIDLTEDCHTYDDALDTFIYILENEHGVEDVEEADIEIKLEGVPTFINDWAGFDDFAPHYFSSHLDDISIWEAADACDIPFSDVEEAYNGSHDSDEAFVEELLQSTGDLDSIPSYVTIDWEATARSIMYDYEEDSGHYFRRF